MSVIIPVFNAGTTIARSIDSVLAQRFPPREIIVVDDGSTDDSPDRINAYGKDVQYLRKPNGGAASARNMGILQSRCDWVAFLDADDEWEPHRLLAQMSYLKKHPEILFVFSDMSHYEHGRIVHQSYFAYKGFRVPPTELIWHKLLCDCFIFTPTVLAKKSVLIEAGLFPEDFRVAEDYYLWLQVAKRYPMGFVDEPLVRRYKENSSSLTTNIIQMLENKLRIYDWIERDNTDGDIKSLILRQRLLCKYLIGYERFKKGEDKMARKILFPLIFHGDHSLKSIKAISASFLPEQLRIFLRGLHNARR